jgi:hypothetical protein
VPIPHREHCVSIPRTTRLILFTETITVYSENHLKQASIMCGENAELFFNDNGKLSGKCNESKEVKLFL